MDSLREFLFGVLELTRGKGSFDCVEALLRCASTSLRMTGLWGAMVLRQWSEAIQAAVQVWRVVGSGDWAALSKSLASFLYWLRWGRGGSGSASCGWGNMRSSF